MEVGESSHGMLFVRTGLVTNTLRARLLGVVRKGIGVFMTASIHLPVLRASPCLTYSTPVSSYTFSTKPSPLLLRLYEEILQYSLC